MTETLWTASEIAAVTKGQLVGDDYAVTGMSIDTRHLQAGDFFIPLKGPNFDGHDFIADAMARGAAGYLSEQPKAEAAKNDHAILVQDSFLALHDLGAGSRARSKARIIAVTGSVGKTSVKAMAHTAFSALGKTYASDASLNNHWGVPLSLARMARDDAYGVFEIGMNHAGEITPLSKLVAPHVAIITTIAPAHIAHFDSVEAIALAKAEIFQGMDVNGVAVLPRDSAQFPILLAEARTQGLVKIITFGEHEEADVRLVSCVEDGTGSDVTATVQGQEVRYRLAVAGCHQAVNSLSILAAVHVLHGITDTVLAAFSMMNTVQGRGNRIQRVLENGKSPLVIIDDTHNASPVAVEASLRTLTHMPKTGKRIVALGDMLELGANEVELHRGLAKAIRQAQPDRILLAGPLMAHLARELPPEITTHYPDSIAMAEEIDRHVAAGDIIMVKGSRGSQMKRVVDAMNRLGQDSSSTKGTEKTSPTTQRVTHTG